MLSKNFGVLLSIEHDEEIIHRDKRLINNHRFIVAMEATGQIIQYQRQRKGENLKEVCIEQVLVDVIRNQRDFFFQRACRNISDHGLIDPILWIRYILNLDGLFGDKSFSIWLMKARER